MGGASAPTLYAQLAASWTPNPSDHRAVPTQAAWLLPPSAPRSTLAPPPRRRTR
ncbi:DUF6053 domain-containing protein [Lysobacter capsici]|uniref:DUF6053 domain-containing protein n=1 Tax=Lysobacter capsici TaxID=435897 RepID=UPI003CCCDA37